MRFASILSEAWRNVATGAGKCMRLALITTALIGGIAIAEVAATQQMVDRVHIYESAGGNITTITSNGAVSGAACESLASVPGVRSSGAMRSSDLSELPLGALPDGNVQRYAVSPGFMDVLGARTSATGVLLPHQLADTLGLRTGDHFFSAAGDQIDVAGVYSFPNDGRAANLANAILEPGIAHGPFDQCWVLTRPYNPAIVGLANMVLWVNAPEGSTIQVNSLNSSVGTAPGAKEFDHRITSYGWLASFGAGLIAAAAVIWQRRKVLAINRHYGVSKPAQLLQVLTEVLFSAVLMVSLAACVSAVFASGNDALPIWLLGVKIAVWGAAGMLVGTGCAVMAVREQALNRYVHD